MLPFPSTLCSVGVNGAVPTWLWNPADKDAAVTLSNGDRTMAVATGVSVAARSASSAGGGVSYAEFRIDAVGAGVAVGAGAIAASTGDYVGADSSGIGYQSGGLVVSNGSTLATLSSFAAGDIIMIAFKVVVTNNIVWFGKNGVWLNGDPSTLTGGSTMSINSVLYAMASAKGGGQISRPLFLTYGIPTGAAVF